MMHIALNSIADVPLCFSRSSVKFQDHTGQKKAYFDPNLEFWTVTPVWIHWWLQNDAQAWTWSRIEEVPYCFSRSSIKFQGHMGQNNDWFWPKLGIPWLWLQFEFNVTPAKSWIWIPFGQDYYAGRSCQIPQIYLVKFSKHLCNTAAKQGAKFPSCGFESLCDLTVKCLIRYWKRALYAKKHLCTLHWKLKKMKKNYANTMIADDMAFWITRSSKAML